MNYEGVCRKAPAKPGLLIMHILNLKPVDVIKHFTQSNNQLKFVLKCLFYSHLDIKKTHWIHYWERSNQKYTFRKQIPG